MLSLPVGKTAAVFIDLQEEHRGDPRYLVAGYERVLANAARLQASSRENAVPLFHFDYVVDMAAGAPRPFHPVDSQGRSVFSDSGDPLAAICPEVAPADGETLLTKRAASAFKDGQFEPLLRGRDIEWLVIAGVWTEACVDATVKDAIELGFRVLLVKDACGSGTAAMHQAGILNLANRLYGGAVTDTNGACRLMAGETIEVWRVHGAVPLRFDFETAPAVYEAL